MLEDRLKNLRKDRGMSLSDVAELVGKSPSTLSRYENNQVEKLDLELIEKIADALSTSAAYLLGMTDNQNYVSKIKTTKYFTNTDLMNVLVTNNELAPEIPYGACVQIRDLKPNEELTINGFYYIEFNNKRCFRMVVDDYVNGFSFLPLRMSERRIAYDKDYVTIIGKAVSMKVFFEDESNQKKCCN